MMMTGVAAVLGVVVLVRPGLMVLWSVCLQSRLFSSRFIIVGCIVVVFSRESFCASE